LHFKAQTGMKTTRVAGACWHLAQSNLRIYDVLCCYDNLLSRLPAYLQQLEMIAKARWTALVGVPSGSCLRGEPGTNGHTFYQLINKGNAGDVNSLWRRVAMRTICTISINFWWPIVWPNQALMRGRTRWTTRAKVADQFVGAESWTIKHATASCR
jgi:glucose-6-phosphate isomerase